MRGGILALLFLMIMGCASADALPRSHRHVPFFFTYRPQTLSRHLTRGLPDDSSKIAAIHSWMCYHIRYDVKKGLRYDFSHQSVRQTLRRRRAICTGYADLFTELCRHAGIKAAQIAGYTKNEEVDITDTFYTDEHMWNMVYLDGQWRPIDVTWDAGYVAQYRVFSLGPIRIVRYRPHFVRDPVDRYYMVSSDIFVRDHLPANPGWQLMDPPLSMEQFARDSSYYYKVLWIDSKYNSSRHDDAYGLRYVAMTADDRIIEDGQKSYAHNHNNQLHIGEAWTVKAEQAAAELHRKVKDTLAELTLCDTIIRRADRAILHYDSMILLLDKEHMERNNFNEQKRQIASGYLDSMLASTRHISIRLVSAVKRSKAAIKSCIRSRATNSKRLAYLYSQHTRVNPHTIPATRIGDSLRAITTLQMLHDTIPHDKERLTRERQYTDQMFSDFMLRCNTYHQEEPVSRRILYQMADTRTGMADDFDHEIKTVRDQLCAQKMKADTNLYLNFTFIADTVFTSMRTYRLDVSAGYRSYRALMVQARALSAASMDPHSADSLYRQLADSAITALHDANRTLDKWVDQTAEVRNLCRAQRKFVSSEKRLLAFNKYIEGRNWLIRLRQINRKASAYTRVTNKERARAIYLRAKAQKQQIRLRPV